MIRINDIKAPLDFDDDFLQSCAAKALKISKGSIKGVGLARKSVDARKKDNIHFNIAINADVHDEDGVLKRIASNGKISKVKYSDFEPIESRLKKSPVIVGFGPAGIFAAYVLALSGAKPIVIERGKPIDERTRDVEAFSINRVLDTESNIQFGEGGAGAFSDGKLNTGTSDSNNYYILKTLAQFGAPQDILTNAKPHIGTDNLKITVKNMRKKIIELGGSVIFGAKFCGVCKKNNKLTAVEYERGGQKYTIETEHCILAIGHSARDVFEYLHDNGIEMIQKNFAVGVRVEHLQSDLNESMYGRFANHPRLSNADYKLVSHTANGQAMYSFCMCPGGTVVPAASEKNGVVTNGMSLFARNNTNANSALLVGISSKNIGSEHPLAAVEFQRKLENAAFLAAGSNYNAPINLVRDFLKGNTSKALGRVKPSYMPGVEFALPDAYLPAFVCDTLRLGIGMASKKIKCFGDGDAVLTGVESRSSSPVRILRGENLCSVSLDGLYPCGEGAGYAGGIMSAAADGIRCAVAVLDNP